MTALLVAALLFAGVDGSPWEAHQPAYRTPLVAAPLWAGAEGTYHCRGGAVTPCCPMWWDDALAAGWPHEELATLDYVMARESGCQQTAYNRSGASGLTQLMPMWWRGQGDPFDGPTNLALALPLWQRSGWHPWCLRGDRVTGSC